MPRVLYLADGFDNGGAERQLVLLVKYLPPEWERRVWAMGDGPFAEAIRDLGVPIDTRTRSWRWDLSPSVDLWATIARWHPDVVHSWGWMCSLAALVACRALQIPFVDGTIRLGMVSPRRGRFMAWSVKLATRVIANSRAGLAAWSVDAARGRVVYNGLDPDRLPLCTRKGESVDPFAVVMTGRMVREKDFAAFLSAARLVAESDGDGWRFLAVGDGAARQELMKSARDLIEAGVVSFPAPSVEVLDLVAESDVGVLMSHPSLHAEGCSNSIIEYMACGLPVVCSDSGGNRELVVDGDTGFIVAPGDVSALVAKLRWLRGHGDRAVRMGEAGRERILREFTVSNVVSRTVSVYDEVTRPRSQHRCRKSSSDIVNGGGRS
ncbi:MAG: glycosyltransferase [Actinobacteria bacterium]|nr:glycosyltransferase [Actinomycetota bacterium]